jgi:hypothetical protein
MLSVEHIMHCIAEVQMEIEYNIGVINAFYRIPVAFTGQKFFPNPTWDPRFWAKIFSLCHEFDE